MSFLSGHYVSEFDPSTDELPKPGSLKYKLYTHDIGKINVCDIDENRYRIENFYDSEEDKTYPQIYCWKGIISGYPNADCKIGTVCDPYSFSGARTRFCLTWGCHDPYLYVADDKGDVVVNERGGIVVFNKKEDCSGGLFNQGKCFVSGIRQSADHLLDPLNRRQLMIQMITVSIVGIIGLIVLLRFRGSKNKRLSGIRKSLSPRFSKTTPLFPKRR